MILLTSLYIANIIVIMILMGNLMISVSEMKYGVYWSLIRYVRFKDYRGIRWIYNNPICLLHILFIVILCLINITLIGQLMENKILNRPIFVLVLSPAAWGCVSFYKYFTDKRIKILERQIRKLKP